MRRCLLLILPLFSFNVASAQNTHDQTLVGVRSWRVPPLPVQDGQIVYNGEVDLEGLSQETLYTRAADWIKYNLKSADASIKHNKKDGRIEGRGKLTYTQKVVTSAAPQAIYFDYDIQTYDGGYRYTISDISGELSGSKLNYSTMYQEELNKIDKEGQWTHKYRYEVLSDMNSFMTLMIQGLRNAMIKD